MSDYFAMALEIAKLEGERHTNNALMKQLRDFLAGALCCQCGEELGHDEEIIQDDDGRTIHKTCASDAVGQRRSRSER